MSADQNLPPMPAPHERRIKGNELIVKDVGFMQAAYELDVAELRLVALAILVLRQDSDRAEFDPTVPVTIHANLYADLFGTSRQNAYNMLEQAAKSLENRKIQWVDTYEDKKRNKKATRYNNLDWTSICSYVPSMGIVQICFTPQIIPFLVHVDTTFAGYEIRNLVKLTSPYEFRLYELGVAWKKTGIATFKRETLRYRLGILSEDQFKTASNFNKMLNKSLSTINRETDLNIEINPNYERNAAAKGRKIRDYTMSVSVKPQVLEQGRETLVGRVKQVSGTAKTAPASENKALPEESEDDVINSFSGNTSLRFGGPADVAKVGNPVPKAVKKAPRSPVVIDHEDLELSRPNKSKHGIVHTDNYIYAYPEEDGSWNVPGILEHFSKTTFLIMGMDEKDIPEELIKGLPQYTKFAETKSELLARQNAMIAISHKIAKTRVKRSASATDTDIKQKAKHGYTHLTQPQLKAVLNNPQFRSRYSPQGMSEYNQINSYLTNLLQGDLNKIPDLQDYLPFSV